MKGTVVVLVLLEVLNMRHTMWRSPISITRDYAVYKLFRPLKQDFPHIAILWTRMISLHVAFIGSQRTRTGAVDGFLALADISVVPCRHSS